MLTVTQVIDAAARDLQDPDNTRWTRSELLDHYNAAQRAFAVMRPDQVAVEFSFVLAAGWRQQIPPDVLHLIEVTNNTVGRQRPITKIETWALDAVMPDWRAARGTTELQHYMHSLKNPTELLVYPPALSGTEIRMVVAPDPKPLSNEMADPTVPVQWLDALFFYVMYRAWSKDAEYAANASLAAANLQLFNDALGAHAQSAAVTEPTS